MEFSAVITIRPIIFFKIQLKKVSGLRKLQIYPMNMVLLLELIFMSIFQVLGSMVCGNK